MKIESVKILENEYSVNKKRVSFHLKECLSDSSLEEYLEFCNLMDVCEYLNLKVIFERYQSG